MSKQIIDSEFQWISRDTDVLVKAYNPTHGDFLVLNELQLRYKPNMPLRMRAYTALAAEKYQLPTFPVLINILPPAANVIVASSYEEEFLGLRAIQDYRVINLWEVDAEIVFQQPLPSLLPFVPILRGGGEPAVVQRAVQLLRANTQLNELEPLLAFFASFVLDVPIIQQIMRWDMAILRESPWYQEILTEGAKIGVQQGIQQGVQQGEKSGAKRQLVRVLQRRFGEIPQDVQTLFEGKSVEQLDSLMDAAITVASLEEFIEIMPV